MQEQIIAALRGGDIAGGLEQARTWAAASPQDPQAHRLLSLALAMHGETAAAHASLDQALSLSPDDGNLHYQRAILFLSQHRHDDARAGLTQAIGVDPNQFRAYIVQAQLALAQADLDEAERLARLAARIEAGHPWVLTVQGLVALHRGQLKDAHGLLSRAVQLAPEDVQTRYALGLSYMAQGHWAFAEQAFSSVLADNPRAHSIRFMLADAMRRQDRFGDAAEALEAGQASDPDMPPDLLRFAGELWLVAGDHMRALPVLRRAAAAQPQDRTTLDALIEALRRQGDPADARHTLDAALAAAPEIEGLWSARMAFEPVDGDIAGVAERWEQAIPGSVHPIHVKMWLAARAGDSEASAAHARRIVALEPGHLEAQTQIIERLYLTEPAAAVEHIQSLLPNIQDPQIMRTVLSWLARAQDRAGQYADAVGSWDQLDAIFDPESVPLPQASSDAMAGAERFPALAQASTQGTGPVFVYGPPGAGVERVIATLAHAGRVLQDRIQKTPPTDPMQFPETALRLASGSLDPAVVAEDWRALLPQRAPLVDNPIDWLPWWDNALLHVFRGSLPDTRLLLVLSDPRDMLLDWLQRGTYVRYAIDSQDTIAGWLAGQLEQLAHLIEGDLMPHRIVRIDGIADDATAIAAAVGDALDTALLPAQALGPGRFPAGHWRAYRDALAGPFALLTPVAVRLGYPEA